MDLKCHLSIARHTHNYNLQFDSCNLKNKKETLQLVSLFVANNLLQPILSSPCESEEIITIAELWKLCRTYTCFTDNLLPHEAAALLELIMPLV